MKHVIDLTMTFGPNSKGFSKETSKTLKKDGWNASSLTFYSHSGTHMDAPVHFDVSDQTIDKIAVSNFVGRAWIVDLRNKGSKSLIYSNDIPTEILKEFRSGDSLILWTDWSKHVSLPKYRDELPRVSEELAFWCVKNGVKMLGVEPPSVADVNNIEEVTKIHQILLQSVVIIEGLTNIEMVNSNCVELIALPLKIYGGDGAPARVIAIQKDL